MSRLCNVAALVALLSFAPSVVSDEPSKEAQRLAGAWRGTAGVWAGKPLTAEQARQCVLRLHPPRLPTDLSGGPRGLHLVVPDKLVGQKVVSPTGKTETRYLTEWKDYSYSPDPSANPPTLKALKLLGLKAHSIWGIYRVKGDTLTLCINFHHPYTLPKEFRSPNGSGVLLLTFQRGK
jgi:hypothetical protein